MTRLNREPPIIVDDLEITPIAKVHLHAECFDGTLIAIARKDPVAVEIRSGDRVWTFSLDGSVTQD